MQSERSPRSSTEQTSPKTFIGGRRTFKIRGSSGKVNIALSGLPKFTGVPDNRYLNRGGQGFVGSLETMERAYDCWKRGTWSDDPFIESVIPSAWDPTVRSRRQALDVELHPVLSAVAERRALDTGEAGRLRRDGDRQARAICAGFKDLIVHMEVRTPHEIENEIGLTEGNIFQGTDD